MVSRAEAGPPRELLRCRGIRSTAGAPRCTAPATAGTAHWPQVRQVRRLGRRSTLARCSSVVPPLSQIPGIRQQRRRVAVALVTAERRRCCRNRLRAGAAAGSERASWAPCGRCDDNRAPMMRWKPVPGTMQVFGEATECPRKGLRSPKHQVGPAAAPPRRCRGASAASAVHEMGGRRGCDRRVRSARSAAPVVAAGTRSARPLPLLPVSATALLR